MNSTSNQKPGPAKSPVWREDILPCFFGRSSHRMFACHHAPAIAVQNSKAVLLCNSIGHEYERCHRTLRQLAAKLATKGNHVTRFDYFGTGDSQGKYDQASLAQWRQDVSQGIDECHRISGFKQLCVIGVRMGATLAAQVAMLREDVDSLVLYAPVTDGQALLTEWKQLQTAYNSKLKHSKAIDPSKEVLGFPITDTIRAELAELGLSKSSNALRRLLVLAENPEDKEVNSIAASLKGNNTDVSIQPLDSPPVWSRDPSEPVVPFKLLQRIIAWVCEQ
jgi:uncharacterized protein